MLSPAMNRITPKLCTYVLALAACWPLGARPISAQQPDHLSGLSGTYIPTPAAVVTAMLRMAHVGPGDVVYDLGSGDGRIVIAAVKEFGAARGVGVELDGARVQEANENARRAGVSERVEFRRHDLFDTDLRPATVVTLYMGQAVNPTAAQAPGRARARGADRFACLRHGRLDAGRQPHRQWASGVLVDGSRTLMLSRAAVPAAIVLAIASSNCAAARRPVNRYGVMSCPAGAADDPLSIDALQCWFKARHGQWRTITHESHFDVLVVQVEAFDLRDAEEIAQRFVAGGRTTFSEILIYVQSDSRATPARIRRVRWTPESGSETIDFTAPPASD